MTGRVARRRDINSNFERLEICLQRSRIHRRELIPGATREYECKGKTRVCNASRVKWLRGRVARAGRRRPENSPFFSGAPFYRGDLKITGNYAKRARRARCHPTTTQRRRHCLSVKDARVSGNIICNRPGGRARRTMLGKCERARGSRKTRAICFMQIKRVMTHPSARARAEIDLTGLFNRD